MLALNDTDPMADPLRDSEQLWGVIESPGYLILKSYHFWQVPIGLLLFFLFTAAAPHSCRGLIVRKSWRSYCSPSILMIPLVFVGLGCLWGAKDHYAPTVPANDAIARGYIGTVAGIPAQFTMFHLLMTAFRVRYTLAKFPLLIICEISKTTLVVVLLHGMHLMVTAGYVGTDSAYYALVIACCVCMLLVTAGRLLWFVYERCNVQKFNMSYFGVGEGDESLMSPGERRGDPWIPVTFSETSIRFRIQYRVLAHAMWVSFFTVFVVGAVLTYTVTDYSAKTDMIYRYYKSFNPCIFFDHYPANLVGSIGVGAMVMVQATQVSFIALHRFALAAESPKNEQPWSNFMFVPFIGPCMLVYAAFSNTFTASLYAEGYPTLHNLTEYKILHPNSTRDQADGLQAHDVESVVTHSIWFVLCT